MPSSDSEDFESADEGLIKHDGKLERKKRTSSNYSENTIGSETETKTQQTSDKTDLNVNVDGWGDFNLEDKIEDVKEPSEKICPKFAINTKKNICPQESKTQKSHDTGWDDFGDWEQEESIKKSNQSANTEKFTENAKETTDDLRTSSNKGWGWGWGVDSFLNTATASISTITSQVSQGLSTVIETSIGAPDPAELARQTVKSNKDPNNKENESKSEQTEPVESCQDSKDSDGDMAFPFGSILSGVTKFVETTGTKVIAGGLDTLETIGKKTMEVLQEGDPGLVRKRAMFGLDSGDKPVLSQVLREAKTRAEEEDKLREEKREAKEVHYENLFDDFEGLVHLEALEMLSRQINMRIEERIRALDPQKKQDAKETLQQVAELCEMPEDDDDDQVCEENAPSMDTFREKLETATQDIGLEIQFQSLIKQYGEVIEWLATDNSQLSDKAVYKRAISALAQTTALAVEVYHKTAELLLVKSRRSTADESDALNQLTVVLTKHVGDLATLFTEKLNNLSPENKEQINNYITNIFLEAGNSSTYIQNAFQLTIPILQIGAV